MYCMYVCCMYVCTCVVWMFGSMVVHVSCTHSLSGGWGMYVQEESLKLCFCQRKNSALY